MTEPIEISSRPLRGSPKLLRTLRRSYKQRRIQVLSDWKGELKVKQGLIGLLIQSMPLVFAVQAHAYIDPGTGSMVVQAFLAAIAAGAVAVGVFWRRLKDLCARLFGRKEDE
jgi:hypothetical protein